MSLRTLSHRACEYLTRGTFVPFNRVRVFIGFVGKLQEFLGYVRLGEYKEDIEINISAILRKYIATAIS